MKIGIDLDEVLFDTIAAMIIFHNKIYKTNLRKEDFRSYHFKDVWGGTQTEAVEKVSKFYPTNYFKNLQPILGAIEGIKKLVKLGELHIVTSRPEKLTLSQTMKSLNVHFSHQFTSVHFTNYYTEYGELKAKADVCLEQGITILVDDSLNYAQECAEKGIKVLLLDKPYNQSSNLPKNVTRVFSWKEIVQIITSPR